MPTREWACRRKAETMRGHESGNNPSLIKSMATPKPTQDMDSTRRVAMAPDALPRRMTKPPAPLGSESPPT